MMRPGLGSGALLGNCRETVLAEVSSVDETELRDSAFGVDWGRVSREDLPQ